MELIIRQFFLNVKTDHDAAGNADRQPYYVQKRVKLLSGDISESCFQVIKKHRGCTFYSCLRASAGFVLAALIALILIVIIAIISASNPDTK